MMHDQSAVCASAQTPSKTMTPRQLSQLCLGHDPLTLPAPAQTRPSARSYRRARRCRRLLLLGLRLLGGALIDRIGIYDLDPHTVLRYEAEMNQIGWPFSTHPLPEVVPVTEEEIFDCDLFVFCATKAVPPIGSGGDVRMLQFEANRKIAAHYGSLRKPPDTEVFLRLSPTRSIRSARKSCCHRVSPRRRSAATAWAS